VDTAATMLATTANLQLLLMQTCMDFSPAFN